LPDLYSLLDGLLFGKKFNLLFVCETWLSSTIPNGLLLYNSSDYVLLRHDRSEGTGGGVCVFVDCKLDYSIVDLPAKYVSLELICLDILQGTTKHRYICVYRPPSYDVASTELIIQCLDWLCDVSWAFTICTDFNLPHFDWHNNFDINSMCLLDACLANFIVNSGAVQLVIKPTRLSNILDLLLVHDPLTTYDVTVAAPFSTSDHCMIMWQSYFPSGISCAGTSRRDFARANYDGLSMYLSAINWYNMFARVHPSDVNGVWLLFKGVLSDAIKLFVPLVQCRLRRRPKYPLFIRRALRRKQELWRSRHQPGMLAQYKRQAARCRRLITKYHTRAERHLINSKSVNAFYRHINRKLDTCQRIPPLKGANGVMLIKDGDKAESFNEYFSSVFTRGDVSIPQCSSLPKSVRESDVVDFSIKTVSDTLRQLKVSKSSGPDGIPSMFWVKLHSVLALPASILFSLSYKFGVVPVDWSHALVTPLYKKGDSSLASNYRPISLTCTLCKAMESIINKNLQHFASINNLIGSNQHGFFPGRSTCTQLLESQFDLCTALDKGIISDVIFIDFTKAFDVVPHNKLVAKLASLGVCGPTLRWVTALLSNRTQAVMLNSVCSRPSSVSSGVVQGSVLGPTLFTLYVSDLPAACPDCSIGQYADDTKASRQIVSPHDRVLLQRSLDALCEWAEKHELTLSLDKCKFLQIGYCDKNICYTINKHMLQPSPSVIDLGVTVQSNLKQGMHCTAIATKANARAKLVLKAFLSRDLRCILHAFTTFVRPMLEYATPVWSPNFKCDVDLIENVQRAFTRKLFNICNIEPTNYDNRLDILGLKRLELRRL
jgi:hypothetical protein